MKSKTTLILFSYLILITSYLSSVQAVTDEELEALEKQIEQQELEGKRKAEAEANKKEKAKRKAEQKQLEYERKRLEAERIKQEEARLAEMEQKQEEAKQKAEKEKKGKYNLLMSEANQAVNNKDKKLAINKYNEALALYPGDLEAINAIKDAEKLMDKICYEFVGTWIVKMFIGEGMVRIRDDGILFHGITDEYSDTWQCIPEKRQIKTTKIDISYTLSEDGTCLSNPTWGGDSCFRRSN